MDEKRQSHTWPPIQSPSSSTTAPPSINHQAQPPRSDFQSPLPPILPTKRPYEDELWSSPHPPAPHPHHSSQRSQPQQPHLQQHPYSRLGPMSSPGTASAAVGAKMLSRRSHDPYAMQQSQQHLDASPTHTRRLSYVQQNPESPSRFGKDAFDDIKLPYGATRRTNSSPSQAAAVAAAAAAAAAHARQQQHAVAVGAGLPPPHGPSGVPSSPQHSSHVTPSGVSGNSTPMDAFIMAAEMGARAQSAVDSASGEGAFETYELGKTIVASSKLYANQRRSNRLLPGGSDSTTAACYMIGGTPDSILSPLVAKVNPCDPREERCKAVERVLKDKTRGAICALNGENPREARADNLAAVRICEVVADILVAYSARRMVESRKELHAACREQEGIINSLREELEKERRKRLELESECWCKGQTDASGAGGSATGANSAGVGGNVGVSGGDSGGGVTGAPGAGRHMMGSDMHQFDREKLVRRGMLGGSTHRSMDSDRGSLSDTRGDKVDGQ